MTKVSSATEGSLTQRTVTHATFSIEREYPATPSRVFEAWADPAQKRRWFAEADGFEVESFEMNFRVGGSERAVFRFSASNPPAGAPLPGTEITNDT
ncbi:MAG TPA: SRPBCC domain-containing protein, partial [Bryobacteraceae bacterium]|nr:SRPBCC domain-containing protein [Bryobacteraceae bacterium]